MCTALTYHTRDHYFGRNLDLEYSYHETVTVTPRNCPLHFRAMPTLERHHAIIGMAYVAQGYPLYYDAVNEHGLAVAGLNFPGNAVYYPRAREKDNIAPFELIPWLLGQCATLREARALLERLNLWDEPFSGQLPLSPLHWLLADRRECIVVETMADGMHIHNDPVGVLTNNPPFDFMMHNLATYRSLSPRTGDCTFAEGAGLAAYCRGLEAVGLPGDWSSASRFVRAAFARLNAQSGDGEGESVSQFFHLLGTVEMPRGCVRLEDGRSDITVYSSCCNQDRGIYYYTTYDNRQIVGVDMHREDLEGRDPVSYPLRAGQSILMEN